MTRKILVVDDNPVSRELVREILCSSEIEVFEAADGQGALDRIGDLVPDLVLLDLRMPLMDGFSVLRKIRQNAGLSRLPVLAFTASAMSGDREKALEAGFNGYLTKPIQAEELRNLIRGHLSLTDAENDI